MVDKIEPDDTPERGRDGRDRGLRVVREGVEARDDRDGRGREPGREAAGRDRRSGEREPGQGRAGGRGRAAGPADPMQPDALERLRRERQDDIAIDPGPDANLDDRDAELDRAAGLRSQASDLRAEADRHQNAADYHDRWMYDADAAAGQATDPADRSLAIRDKNEHRASSEINEGESELDDRRADAADAAADRQVAAAPPPPRGGEGRRVADTKYAQQHSGVQVKEDSPLTDASEAPRSTRSTQGRQGRRRAPQAPGKDRDGRHR